MGRPAAPVLRDAGVPHLRHPHARGRDAGHAALIQATVVKLYRLHARNQSWRLCGRALIAENKWRPARTGSMARSSISGVSAKCPARDLIAEYLEFVDDVLDELGGRQAVEHPLDSRTWDGRGPATAAPTTSRAETSKPSSSA